MRRDKESGFALLLVFLMAAVIAISLYSEIPRIAFQSQRHKEQLLMERGQQYMRAIQVYRQVNRNQWPAKIEDIETFQNRHFLRHKYIDPMTGKDEWRLIHIQGNILTDSLLTKKPSDKPGAGSESSYIGAYADLGDTQPGAQGFRPQDRRRASEGPSAPGAEGQLPPSPPDPNSPLASGAQPGSNTSPPGAPGMPGTNVPGQAGTPGTNVPDQTQGGAYVGALPGIGAPVQPGQPFPGAPGQPGQPGYPNPQAPGAAPQGPNAAVSMINQLLTTPNPRAAQIIAQQNQPTGSPGLPDNPVPGFSVPGGSFASGPGASSPGSAAPGAGPSSGAFVAGVASKMEQEGIMVYNDRTAYNEWEFVFDPAKVTPIPPPGGGGVPGSTPASRTTSPAGTGPQTGPGGPGGQPATMGMGPQMGGQMGPGAPGSGAGGSTSNPAGMQTAGGPAPNLPAIRMGRP